mmetsp:Transcript_12991/g.19552  ORF Transcript_12991/g.19552 Transcript_12991/m.19552 type:complete len:90 (-) Transcript_12991:776-1045(-)
MLGLGSSFTLSSKYFDKKYRRLFQNRYNHHKSYHLTIHKASLSWLFKSISSHKQKGLPGFDHHQSIGFPRNKFRNGIFTTRLNIYEEIA